MWRIHAMFRLIKKLLGLDRDQWVEWRLFFTQTSPIPQVIELGTFAGTEEEAEDEVYMRHINWVFSSGKSDVATGSLGLERIDTDGHTRKH